MKFWLILAMVLAAISAQAAQTNEQFRFETYWSGFRVAEMFVVANQSDSDYNLVVTINSEGIAKLASNYSSVNTVSGEVIDGKLRPEIYNSKWWRKDEKQKIELQFSRSGEVVSESLIPPERVGKRPDVDKKFKQNVVDPVTAAFVSRETIRAELKNNPNSRAVFAVPTFDAKRRFDVIITIKGYKKIEIGGKMQNLLHINLRREPLAGFREKDLLEMKEEQQTIDFYLNKNLVPVWGSAKAQMGSATIKLVK
jgi:hypothetical protein